MIGTRHDVTRWMVLPLFVAMVSATSIVAEVRVSFLERADGTDHLFRSVTDRGAEARPINGTVTETASQARIAASTHRAADRAASASQALRGTSGTVTETASERRLQGPGVGTAPEVGSIGDLPAPPESFRFVSDLTGRRGTAMIALRELRQLREENRALQKLVKDLCGQADSKNNRDGKTPKRRSRERLSAAVLTAR